MCGSFGNLLISVEATTNCRGFTKHIVVHSWSSRLAQIEAGSGLMSVFLRHGKVEFGYQGCQSVSTAPETLKAVVRASHNKAFVKAGLDESKSNKEYEG